MEPEISYDDCVITDRGGVVENKHNVHAAVVNSAGELLFSVGNPERVTLARSAAKPAQALAVLESGGFECFGFDEADLALMCASHNAEPAHLERALHMLAKAGASEADLRCGGHPSIWPALDRKWIQDGVVPSAVYNNCSGKHAGMLAGARAVGAPTEGYHLSHHPMQLRVRAAIEDLSGLSGDHIRWGIDGCNLPAPALPLSHFAKIFASFATAADVAAALDGSAVPARVSHQARIFHAMTTHPDMVAGQHRFCTQLMRAYQGALIGKVGAEGCYGVGIRASDQTRLLGTKGAVGIAVKIEDGNLEILYAVVAEILEQLNISTPETLAQLAEFQHLKRLNTMNVVTGNVTLSFKVRPAPLYVM